MTLVDPDSTQSSRRRLLEAGKALFARFGFEQTSTAIIAREAGTSESQLVRYYKGKAGLLEAIFNDCWAALNQHVQGVVVAATDAREALAGQRVRRNPREGLGGSVADAILLARHDVVEDRPAVLLDRSVGRAALAAEAVVGDRTGESDFDRRTVADAHAASAQRVRQLV